jgi:hypothetical protein
MMFSICWICLAVRSQLSDDRLLRLETTSRSSCRLNELEVHQPQVAKALRFWPSLTWQWLLGYEGSLWQNQYLTRELSKSISMQRSLSFSGGFEKGCKFIWL